ncbi:MAG: TetR/AcrR family transcriptional regulator [Actinomycetota bacterium]
MGDADDTPRGPKRGAGTRDQILAAAAELIDEAGMAATTTRAIAERAGCAEGSIYRHFPDKHGLLLEIMKGRFPSVIELFATLPGRAGSGTVEGTIRELLTVALGFYRSIIPMVAGAVAQRDLVEQQRRYFNETNTGPLRVLQSVADYIRGEQELGRVAGHLSPDHVARILLGTCFVQAFLEHLMGPKAVLGPDAQFAATAAAAVADGLLPRP